MKWILAAALVCVVLMAMPAKADAAETVYVTKTVSTVSGAQLAAEALRSVRGLDIGSTSATVTVEVDGSLRDIPVGYASAFGLGEESRGLSLTTLALWSVVGSVFLRGLGLLTRLGRRF